MRYLKTYEDFINVIKVDTKKEKRELRNKKLNRIFNKDNEKRDSKLYKNT